MNPHHLILYALTAILMFFGWHVASMIHGAALVRRQAEQDEQAGQPR